MSSDYSWIGFDLDGTLHDMVRVQSVADHAVFDAIAVKADSSADALREIYYSVSGRYLHPDFFANGMSAQEIRSLRYKVFLDHIGILNEALVERCVAIFYTTFAQNAAPYPGVVESLHTLKSSGYRIAIITERPHDSAEHALACLGLSPLVDMLVTTGGERVSKPDGLFGRAMERMDAGDRVIPLVGDRLDRDIRPALAAGMRPIWYVHPDDVPQVIPNDLTDSIVQVNCHRDMLRFILPTGPATAPDHRL